MGIKGALNILVNYINRFLLTFFCLFVAIGPAFAARATTKTKQAVKVNQGVVLYNSGQYLAALPILVKTIKNSPSDPLYHYYLGLCYDRLHSEASAKQQFQWVARNSKDARLRSYAETALHGNSASVSTAGSTSPEAPEPADNAAANTSASSDNNDAVTSSRLPFGRAKIYFFQSSNRESQEFAPIFDRAARAYRGSLTLQRLDASSPATNSLMQKYAVKTFPHLIYLDGKGKEIYNEGPKTFNVRMSELLGR